MQEREDLHPAWTVAVQDIKELQKRGGYGWKAKLVVGWALGREVHDGLTIVDRKGNKVWICYKIHVPQMTNAKRSGNSPPCLFETSCSTALPLWVARSGSYLESQVPFASLWCSYFKQHAASNRSVDEVFTVALRIKS